MSPETSSTAKASQGLPDSEITVDHEQIAWLSTAEAFLEIGEAIEDGGPGTDSHVIAICRAQALRCQRQAQLAIERDKSFTAEIDPAWMDHIEIGARFGKPREAKSDEKP